MLISSLLEASFGETIISAGFHLSISSSRLENFSCPCQVDAHDSPVEESITAMLRDDFSVTMAAKTLLSLVDSNDSSYRLPGVYILVTTLSSNLAPSLNSCSCSATVTLNPDFSIILRLSSSACHGKPAIGIGLADFLSRDVRVKPRTGEAISASL